LGQRVGFLVDALQRWLQQHPERDPARTFFWICDFCIRQSGGDTKADVGRLGDMVRAIGHTVLYLDPWHAPAPLLRAWCLWEIYHTVDGSATLDVVMSAEQQAHFTEALMGDYDCIAQALSEVSVRKAETRKAEDKEMIMTQVAELEGGAQRLDEVIQERLREWVADAGRAALGALPAAERATSSLLNKLAMLLYHQGRLDEARPLLEEALTGRRAALGDAHPDTLTSVNNLATLLQDQGRLDEAQPLLEDTLAGKRAALGDAHSSTLTSISNLGGVLYAQGKLDKARLLLEEALAGMRAELGDTHVDTLTLINNLGSLLLYGQGKAEEAWPLFVEALAGLRATLGAAHPTTLQSMNNLAMLLSFTGAMDQARPLFVEALAGERVALGNSHPQTLVSIHNFGQLLWEEGNLDGALAMFEEALAGNIATLGEAHPHCEQTRNWVAGLREQLR
jgi:tetratricopeptide (TPR) repeat protein